MCPVVCGRLDLGCSVSYSLAIDLGTTFCAAAVYSDGKADSFPLGNRAAAIPSVVTVREDGELLLGEAAERRAVLAPARSAREFKRRLGDPTPIVLGGTPYGPESLMAHLYRAIVEKVVAQRGERPDRVVITHPANYGPYKLDLLSEAVRMAGLRTASFITEPEAAAIHYGQQARVSEGELVAVYDFGGGTFDAAVLRKTSDGFQLLGAPEGLDRLGGTDFDYAVLAHVRQELGGHLDRLDASDPAVRGGLARLWTECVSAKEALSVDTDVTIPVLLPTVAAEVRLTRQQFEDMIRPRIGETVAALERAVSGAGVAMGELSRILLVGGTSRIPLVAEVVRSTTGRDVAVDTHPKFSVAIGAALFAGAGGLAAVGLTASAPVVPARRTEPTGAASPSGPSVVPAADVVPIGATNVTASPSAVVESTAADGQGLTGPVLSLDEGTRDARPGSPVGLNGRNRIPSRLVRPVIAIAALLAVVALVAGALAFVQRGDDADTTTTAVATPGPAESPAPTIWRVLRDAPTSRQQVAATIADNTAWLFGGLEDRGSTSKVDGYDAAIDTWKSGPDLPLALHHAMAVTYKGELVVLGGWAPSGANLTAEASSRVYTLRRSKWVELPHMKRGRAAGAAAVVGDKIVVAGGQADGRLIEATEVFDGTSWQDAAPIPTPRDHLAAAPDDRFMYAVGGRNLSADRNSAALERYDPATDSWSKLPDMPTPRGGLGAALAGGRLIALGGESPTAVFDTVEAYDVGAATWAELPAMRTPRHGMGVVAMGSAVYTFTGAKAPSHAVSSPAAEVLGVADKGGPSATAKSAWRSVNPAPTARQQVAATVADGTVWVFGGLEERGSTAKSEGYDPAIDTWKAGPDMPLSLHHAMAVTYRGEMVVLGGWVQVGGDTTAQTSDRVFALRRGSWVELPRLSRRRAAGAAAVVGDRIVVVGGQSDGRLVEVTEVFDGTAWKEGAPMPTLREHLAVASDGEFIYAVGGRSLSADKNSGALERYDSRADAWQKLPDMPTARGGLGAAVAAGRLVVVGGEHPTGVFDAVEAFDPASGTWSPLPAMITPRHGVGVVAVGNAVYAVNGARTPSHAISSPVIEVMVVS